MNKIVFPTYNGVVVHSDDKKVISAINCDGKKKLKSFLIDKKIPQRKRNFLPVLADGNEIYAIAGVEISEKVRVEDVPTAYMIEVKNG